MAGGVRFLIDAPADGPAAAAELSELVGQVLDYAADQQRAEKGHGPDEGSSRSRRRALQALADVERSREKPLEILREPEAGPFRDVEFVLAGMPPEEIVVEQRIADLADGSLLAGEITRVLGKELLLRIEKGDPSQLPRRGKLRVYAVARPRCVGKNLPLTHFNNEKLFVAIWRISCSTPRLRRYRAQAAKRQPGFRPSLTSRSGEP